MSTTLWEAALALPVWPSRDHIRGPIDAAVTLLEYGDYECPYCGAAHAIVSAIQAHMAAELRFVFRHFPMTTNSSACPAGGGGGRGRGCPGKVLGDA